jgi:thiol-disulfide isomerase/thioredoxin
MINSEYFGEIKGTKSQTKEEFEKKLKDKSTTFVLFYAEWCGYCKSIREKWNKMGKTNNMDDFQMVCIESQNIDPSFGILGYPSLKVSKKGKLTDYTGGREFKDMADHFKMCEGCGKKKRN